MAPKHGALVLFGSGPGIGSHVAHHFAKNSFSHIILLSRNLERLSKEAEFVSSGNPDVKVDTIAIDLADLDSIFNALAQVDEKLGGNALEVVVYNAARVVPSKFFDYGVGDVATDLQITVTAMYAAAQWAFPKLEAARSVDAHKPCFLVTSGGISKEPIPAVFSLSACKAAQYSLVQSLYKEYSAQGIHAALVVVSGVVSEESRYCSPTMVADKFWELYGQTRHWELSLELVDPDFSM